MLTPFQLHFQAILSFLEMGRPHRSILPFPNLACFNYILHTSSASTGGETATIYNKCAQVDEVTSSWACGIDNV